ncbi:MAG: hypothetical protein QOG69_1892 [Actinomycetota bacterium]|jgi:hypothetical protein|nr:hypothetical protein [Actinomycetota bacterium]
MAIDSPTAAATAAPATSMTAIGHKGRDGRRRPPGVVSRSNCAISVTTDTTLVVTWPTPQHLSEREPN